MSIISALQSYVLDFSGIDSSTPVWVNYLGAVPVEVSVVPMTGERIVETNILGKTTRVFPFALQVVGSTADDLARLNTIEFYEAFAAWLEQQTLDGVFPILGTGQTAIEISASGWGYLYEIGQSDTGIYQITAQLVYEQNPGVPGD